MPSSIHSRRFVGSVSAAMLAASSLLMQGYAQDAPLETSAQRAEIAYTMRVRLDPETKALTGTQVITWRNPSLEDVSELRFHMYLNAFRDAESTFMREAGPEFRSLWEEGEFGGVEIEQMSVADPEGGDPRSVPWQYISPDDGNPNDRTVLAAALPLPVAPGAKVEVRTTFRADLPKAYRRTGWLPGNGFFCMQWFPKLGVLEIDATTGKPVWDCAQFHANGEFHADFASFDVTIEVPDGFVVGATGGVPVESTTTDGWQRLRFRQDGVHDFAWVTDPDFVVEERDLGPFDASHDPGGIAAEVDRALGAKAVETPAASQPAVKVRVLLQPQHATRTQFDRHFAAVECGLTFYGLRFGPYPYPVLTAVDPGLDISGRTLGGGMEYPTLITCGSMPFPHRRQLRPEGVTVHEFGHQFWYGLVANDEVHEAWLDEGFTTYTEGRAQWLFYDEQRRPVQTTRFGRVVTVGSTPAVPMAGRGVLAHDRLPLELLPDVWREPLAAQRFEGVIVPRSAQLLDFVAAMPTVGFAREARYSDCWNDRRRLMSVDNPDPLAAPVWTYLTRSSYVANAYHRPAMLLRTMERMAGKTAWWTFLREFHASFRGKHATTAAFLTALESSLGGEIAEFFRLATVAGAIFDYGIERVNAADPSQEVVIRRHGGVRADISVRFRFADGQVVTRVLSADDDRPWWSFRFPLRDPDAPSVGEGWAEIVEVWVDPPAPDHEGPESPVGTFLIDANLLDNAWRARRDPVPALYRAMRALQQAQFQLTLPALAG